MNRYVLKNGWETRRMFRKLYSMMISKRKEIEEFMKFGVVGFINTVLSYSINNIGYYKCGIGAQISNLIAFVITVFISYWLNSRFVFDSKARNVKESMKMLGKAYVSYSVTGLFLTAVLLYFEENFIGIPHYIATFINTVISVPINFMLNKFWTYKKMTV